MSTWTREPWEVEKSDYEYEYWISPKKSEYIIAVVSDGVEGMHNAEANARRIVACVNACKGMVDPDTEIGALRVSLQDMLEYAEEDALITPPSAVINKEMWSVYRSKIAKARALLGEKE